MELAELAAGFRPDLEFESRIRISKQYWQGTGSQCYYSTQRKNIARCTRAEIQNWFNCLGSVRRRKTSSTRYSFLFGDENAAEKNRSQPTRRKTKTKTKNPSKVVFWSPLTRPSERSPFGVHNTNKFIVIGFVASGITGAGSSNVWIRTPGFYI